MEKDDLLQLVKQTKKGVPGAFEQLCELKVPRVIYISSKLMGNLHDAEDIAQEVMFQVYRDIGNLKSAKAFNTWLYRMIIGECNKAKRKIYMNEEYSMGQLIDFLDETNQDFIPQEYLEHAEKRKLLTHAVDSLRPKNKACILLFYYEDMSYEEIARALDIPKKEVANRLLRSRQYIRRTLEGEGQKGTFGAFALGVGAPVLTQLFEQEAGAISAQFTQQAVGAILLRTASVPPTAAASAASAAVMTKVVAAGALVSTAGIQIYMNNVRHAPPEQSSYPSSVIAPQKPPLAQPASLAIAFPDSSYRLESPEEIHTLEDMIGDENAKLLRQYSSQGTGADTLQAFVLDVGMDAHQRGTNTVTQEQYTLYLLTRQEKSLKIMVRQSGDSTQVVYLFTAADAPVPQMDEIMACFSSKPAPQ